VQLDKRNAETHSAAARERRQALMGGGRIRAKTEIAPVSILLGFVPFIVFALLGNVSIDLALWCAFATAFAIAIRDFAHTQRLRQLDVVSMALFGAMALYVGFIEPGMPIQMARLVADAALFLLSAGSLVIGQPLIGEYAREQVPREFWLQKRFVLTNYLVTGGWTLAFALMAATDAYANKNKRLPLSLDLGICLTVLAVAIICTARYPHYLRAQVARSAGKRV